MLWPILPFIRAVGRRHEHPGIEQRRRVRDGPHGAYTGGHNLIRPVLASATNRRPELPPDQGSTCSTK
jgi:hypothetical protein